MHASFLGGIEQFSVLLLPLLVSSFMIPLMLVFFSHFARADICLREKNEKKMFFHEKEDRN